MSGLLGRLGLDLDLVLMEVPVIDRPKSAMITDRSIQNAAIELIMIIFLV
jgi:hypothetical protein